MFSLAMIPPGFAGEKSRRGKAWSGSVGNSLKKRASSCGTESLDTPVLASLMKTIKPMTHRGGVGKVTRGPSEHITINFAANVLRS